MKIIHTADLHLGQIIYQHYDRVDEHEHFFSQLSDLCRREKPDALVVSGDIFDIQQPSAATRRWFTEHFVSLSQSCPEMTVVITAGNHDSASRLEADSSLWRLANTRIVGMSPSPDLSDSENGWQERYIVRLSGGFIIALPYLSSPRPEMIQSILDYVGRLNGEGLPVIMSAHQAVTGMDATGHDFEIGTIKTLDLASMGLGYDYLALGHIHKPQTLGHKDSEWDATAVLEAPVARYSGSAIHVSCDECYPHSVTIVDIGKHGDTVTVRQERIRQLRHFFTLPIDGSSYKSAEEALKGVKQFAEEQKSGYIRLRIDYSSLLPADFNQSVYDILSPYGEEMRYNPKIIWTGRDEAQEKEESRQLFDIADFQEMRNPLEFIEKTIDQYPGLDMGQIVSAFKEIEEEVTRLSELSGPQKSKLS